MELYIEQTLQQGIAAHKEGKIRDAERLYRAILKCQPTHADANHKLGLLASSVNKVDVAIPMFKTALEADPKNEGFWFSYIDALIKEKQFDNASQVLDQAKSLYLDGEKLSNLELQLDSITMARAINFEAPSQQNINRLLEYYKNGRYGDAQHLAVSITEQFPNHQFSWKVLGALLIQTGEISDALKANQKAVALDPQDAEARSNLGVTLKELGRVDESVEHLKQAIELNPVNLKARISLDTVTSSIVPSWHFSMMHDEVRNNAYFDAIKLAVGDGECVLDIGAGSGLLSLMAAASGAGKVIACETSRTIAQATKAIIEGNGYEETISVVNKHSTDLIVGKDLPQRADVIISEILSSEFVGEGVRTTILDANKRLLKKGGTMIPQSGAIRIALIDNSPEIFNNTSVADVHGFDLSKFNSISQAKFTPHLANKPVLLSNYEDAFKINLYDSSEVIGEEKVIKLQAIQGGLCVGLIQWIWVHLYKEVEYENKPGENNSHWRTPVYLFDDPVAVQAGDVIEVKAILTDDYVWFCQVMNAK